MKHRRQIRHWLQRNNKNFVASCYLEYRNLGGEERFSCFIRSHGSLEIVTNKWTINFTVDKTSAVGVEPNTRRSQRSFDMVKGTASKKILDREFKSDSIRK